MSNKMFFIQDTRSYHGNAMIWWGKNGSGYTANVHEAWQVDEAKARSIEANRSTDKAWPVDVIMQSSALETVVRMDLLRKET